jgi:hypothetical protein
MLKTNLNPSVLPNIDCGIRILIGIMIVAIYIISAETSTRPSSLQDLRKNLLVCVDLLARVNNIG